MKPTARHLFRGHVRHRREYGAAAPQQLVHCPTCDATTSATVHGTLLRCTEGHQIGGDQ